jgi:hypothetical protein
MRCVRALDVGSRPRAQGLGFRVSGLGLRVKVRVRGSGPRPRAVCALASSSVCLTWEMYVDGSGWSSSVSFIESKILRAFNLVVACGM